MDALEGDGGESCILNKYIIKAKTNKSFSAYWSFFLNSDTFFGDWFSILHKTIFKKYFEDQNKGFS